MPCYSPLEGWYSRYRNPSGKRSIVFNKADAYVDMPVVVPCGQCIGCRLERSRQWAIRCLHEAQLHQESCFVTLTYDDEHLPADGSLNKRHFQLFMKRLRKHFKGQRIRYFHCGEYGDTTNRPHYHAVLFGVDFSDRVLYRQAESGDSFVSATLANLWGLGFATLGQVSFESAAYVARYCLKKRTGKNASSHYERVIVETGEVVNVLPEYTTMSLRPGIAAGWFDRYASDVFPSDSVVVRGLEMRPPKFYDSRFEILDKDAMAVIKGRRVRQASKHPDESSPVRLRVRERCKRAQISTLRRSAE